MMPSLVLSLDAQLLAIWLGRSGRVLPDDADIADILGWSVRRVRATLAELEAARVLRVEWSTEGGEL